MESTVRWSRIRSRPLTASSAGPPFLFQLPRCGARTNSASSPSSANRPSSWAMNQGRLWTTLVISLRTICTLLTPHFGRGIGHELELAALVVHGQQVALGHGREPALRAE